MHLRRPSRHVLRLLAYPIMPFQLDSLLSAALCLGQCHHGWHFLLGPLVACAYDVHLHLACPGALCTWDMSMLRAASAAAYRSQTNILRKLVILAEHIGQCPIFSWMFLAQPSQAQRWPHGTKAHSGGASMQTTHSSR